MLVKLEWLGSVWWKNYDDMLSRFHLIPERYGRTDRRTYLLYQYRASVCWRAINMHRFRWNSRETYIYEYLPRIDKIITFWGKWNRNKGAEYERKFESKLIDFAAMSNSCRHLANEFTFTAQTTRWDRWHNFTLIWRFHSKPSYGYPI